MHEAPVKARGRRKRGPDRRCSAAEGNDQGGDGDWSQRGLRRSSRKRSNVLAIGLLVQLTDYV